MKFDVLTIDDKSLLSFFIYLLSLLMPYNWWLSLLMPYTCTFADGFAIGRLAKAISWYFVLVNHHISFMN